MGQKCWLINLFDKPIGAHVAHAGLIVHNVFIRNALWYSTNYALQYNYQLYGQFWLSSPSPPQECNLGLLKAYIYISFFPPIKTRTTRGSVDLAILLEDSSLCQMDDRLISYGVTRIPISHGYPSIKIIDWISWKSFHNNSLIHSFYKVNRIQFLNNS